MPVVENGDLDARAARLATLATGFSWHTRLHAIDQSSIARARTRTARECDDDRRSPLAPESALVLAERASRGLSPGARVVVVDGALALAGAFADRGFEVTGLVAAGDEGLFADEPTVDARAFDLRAPVDAALVASADLVVVDTFRREGAIIPLVCRALAMTKANGRVSLLAHALLRDHVRTLLGVVGADVRARDDELVARLFSGARLADIAWDHVTIARTPDEAHPLPVAAGTALSERALYDHDAELERHGCVEVHGLVPPFADDAHRLVVASLARREGRSVVHGADHTDGTRRQFHAILDDHTSLTGHLDAARGVFRADITRWTPTRHADLIASVLETLPLDDTPLRFTASA